MVRKNRYAAAVCAVLLIIGIGLWSQYNIAILILGGLSVLVLLAANHWLATERGGEAALVQILAIIGLVVGFAIFSPRMERLDFYLNLLLAVSLGTAVYGFVRTEILQRESRKPAD